MSGRNTITTVITIVLCTTFAGEAYGGGAPGACCFPDGTCQDGLLQDECKGAGGVWQGPDSSCDAGCASGKFEACCFPDGSCVDLPREECLIQGGDPQGPGSFCNGPSCDPFLCGEPGSGSCFVAHPNPGCDNLECCELICSIDPFCCTVEWDQLCVDEAIQHCAGAPPVGACCLSATECFVAPIEQCDAAGGIFLGPGSDCPQQIMVVNHNGPQDQWSHTIETVGECPDPQGAGPGCEAGPYNVDPWETSLSSGSNCENFGHPDSCPIPADFFGPGSDPYTGLACFTGSPLGNPSLPGFPDPLDFGDADTLVKRDGDPFDRCELPSTTQSTVDIEIVALHLVSTAPITVTYNGGQDPQEWSMEVLVSPGGTAQPGGTLTATKTHCNGGTFDSVLAVCPSFVFTEVGNPLNQLTLNFCGDCNPAGIVMTAAGLPWIHDVGVNIGLVSPVCSDFHPGIAELNPTAACDCNGNQTRDACDIESGTSLDCDADGVPDECQAPPPCANDLNGNCSVDFADILQIIGAWGPCGVPCPEDLNGNGNVDFADILLVVGAFGPC